MNIKPTHYKILILGISCLLLPMYAFATLSCAVTTSCSDTVVMNLEKLANTHGELPSLSNYTNQVCCSGLVGLSNSCSNANSKVFANLRTATNSHAEIGSLSNYTNPLCISSASASDVFTIAYLPVSDGTCDANNYDTTIVLLEDSTNAQIYEAEPTNFSTLGGMGIGVSVCASVFSQSITFSISDNTVGFGTLSSSSARYATGDTLGSASTVAAHTIDVSTNAAYGYSLYVVGPTLSSGAHTVDAIGGTAVLPSAGTEQFGLWSSVTGSGYSSVSSPYDISGYFAYNATSTVPSEIASASTGDGVTSTYSIRYVGNISPTTEPGSYSTALTYIATANF